MSELTYIVQFAGAEVADANLYAGQLRDAILDAAPEVSVKTRRADRDAQDLGATLVLLLGTPAVIVLAKALGDWLKLHRSVAVDITTPDGSIVAKNLTAKDARELAALLTGERKG
ncbi:MAG TPA: hypothetical protein VF586_03240 [Pyrinomonadaceae bacterium]|jgi:hypothetical protein